MQPNKRSPPHARCSPTKIRRQWTLQAQQATLDAQATSLVPQETQVVPQRALWLRFRLSRSIAGATSITMENVFWFRSIQL